MKGAAKRKVPATRMQFRAYEIASRAVEEGVGYGWNRAHKHTNEPDAAGAKDAIVTAVMSALCEVIDFTPEDSNG